MSRNDIRCYQCGASLAALTLPFSRRDMCPECAVHLHACRQCAEYDPTVLGQCLEEEAEEVKDKVHVNYCEWFRPHHDAFDETARGAQVRAADALAGLFGDDAGEQQSGSDEPPASVARAAEDLFK